MKHQSKFLMAAAVALAGSVLAQESEVSAAEVQGVPREQSDRARWYVSPGVGIMVLDGPAKNEPAMFDLKLGYDLTERWSIEGGMMYVPSIDTAKPSKGDQMTGPSVDVLYHLLDPYSRWDVYLSAGLAYWFGDGAVFQGDYHEGLLPRLGGGVAYHLTDDWSVRLDGKVGIPTQSDSFGPSLIETATLGVVYRFGGSGSAEPEVVPVAPEAQEYNEKLQEISKGTVVDATPPDAQDVMLLELYINFDYDQTIIKPEYYAGLGEITRVIKKAVAKNPAVTVSVEGHADRRHKSDAKYNQDLSERRAEAVKQFIVAKGVDAAALTTVGYGFTRPKVTPDLENGNPENRRVDIFIRGVGDAASRNELRKAD